MAAAATRLLKYPDRARLMASQAYEQLDRYSWSRVGSQWSTLYDDIMGGSHMRRMEGIHRAA